MTGLSLMKMRLNCTCLLTPKVSHLPMKHLMNPIPILKIFFQFQFLKRASFQMKLPQMCPLRLMLTPFKMKIRRVLAHLTTLAFQMRLPSPLRNLRRPFLCMNRNLKRPLLSMNRNNLFKMVNSQLRVNPSPQLPQMSTTQKSMTKKSLPKNQ